MFSYDKDILIDDIHLWLDSRRVRELGFISHGHADHIARHKKILCSGPTARFIRKRIKNPSISIQPFGHKFNMGTAELSLHPAGHILGSSQIRISDQGHTLLYTGDFRLKPSLTAEPFEYVSADTVIMESTFGRPQYRLPDRDLVVDELTDLCRKLLKEGRVPVVLAYALGKGQEALKILTDAGLPVAADYSILRYVPLYEDSGITFGSYEKFRRSEYRDKVLLLPVGFRFNRFLRDLPAVTTIYLSGWALDRYAPQRLKVDKVLPLSDHADFDELMQFVETIQPQQIWCTHGFDEFVGFLKQAGFRARSLDQWNQLELPL